MQQLRAGTFVLPAAAGPAGSPLPTLPVVPGGGPGPTNFVAKIHVHREKCYIVFRSETCFFFGGRLPRCSDYSKRFKKNLLFLSLRTRNKFTRTCNPGAPAPSGAQGWVRSPPVASSPEEEFKQLWKRLMDAPPDQEYPQTQPKRGYSENMRPLRPL